MSIVRVRYLRDSKVDPRHIAFQQNMKAGLVIRAIRCDGASHWGIHENRLLWTDRDEEIPIRDMKKIERYIIRRIKYHELQY